MLGELFDPKAEYFVQDRLRPHWSQAGAIVFITARTRDSIPKQVLELWDREKNEWLDLHEINQGIQIRRGRKWSEAIDELNDVDRIEFHKHFNRKREVTLDECHGACVLRDRRFAELIAESLLHFDGDRYHMGDFVIMPNHFHLLVAFSTPEAMSAQIDSWLHFTATQINRITGVRGHFWQQEPFDHLVRSEKQYQFLRNYIADNPRKANLREGEYLYRRLDHSR